MKITMFLFLPFLASPIHQGHATSDLETALKLHEELEYLNDIVKVQSHASQKDELHVKKIDHKTLKKTKAKTLEEEFFSH